MSKHPQSSTGGGRPGGGHGDVAGRAPVLYPGELLRAWADGADWRIAVTEDGSLVWRKPTSTIVLAAPGGVRDIQHVDAGSRVGDKILADESIVFLRDDAAPVVLPVGHWTPPGTITTADSLTRGGFRSIVEALGRSDAWTFDVHGQGNEVKAMLAQQPAPLVLRPAQGAVLLRHSVASLCAGLAAIVLCGAVEITARITNGTAPRWPLILCTAVAFAAVAVVLGWGLCAVRGAQRRYVAPVPDARIAVEGLPQPVQLATQNDGTLVLVAPDGAQTALPGPTCGGVTKAVALMQPGVGLRRLQLLLDTGEGIDSIPVAELDSTWWRGPDDVARVQHWLADSGIEWHEISVPKNAPVPPSHAANVAEPVWPPSLRRNFSVLAPLLVFTSFFLALVTFLPVIAVGVAGASYWLVVYLRHRKRRGPAGV